MRRFSSVAVILAVLALSACSTVVHDKYQQVNITSNPPGATLKIDGRSFVTPATVLLKGKSEHFFTLEKAGYKTTGGKVDGDFRIWSAVIGNIFNFTGVIGFAVDFWGTETAFELQKDNSVTLEPLPMMNASPYDGVPPAAPGMVPQPQFAPAPAVAPQGGTRY
jgi:hypothetical protein